MSYRSYKPFKKKNHLTKYTIMFFLGVFFVLFFASALTIVTDIENAVQYIKKIVITSDGMSSGSPIIVLDGTDQDRAVYVDGNIQVSGSGLFIKLLAGDYSEPLKTETVGVFGGRVGIGKTSPNKLLDVAGDINVDGTGNFDNIYVNNGVFQSNIRIPSVSSTTGASNDCTIFATLKYEFAFQELCMCNGTQRIKVSNPSLLCVPGVGGEQPK